jgi:hypothetical protein
MEKAMSSACQTQLAAVPIEQQFVNEWSLTLARKICSDSVNHTPSCGNQNIRSFGVGWRQETQQDIRENGNEHSPTRNLLKNNLNTKCIL